MNRFIAKGTISFLILAAGALGSFYSYQYIQNRKPCVKAIAYAIGTFDTRFDISEADFLQSIHEATLVWEEAIGKDLFVHDANGKLLINLIFDDRQKATEEQREIEKKINRTQAQYKEKVAFLEERKDVYERAVMDYEASADEFEQRASRYESNVRYWNRQGSVPQAVYQKIKDEQKALENMRAIVEAKRISVNSLAGEINDLIALVNALARKTNSTVDVYNHGDFIGVQFDQGLYVRKGNKVSINIYQFTDHEKLVRVLAHEFGHVLGLDHNENSDSIMFELNQSENDTLTAEDIASLREACNL